ncbi:MAG: OmpA family protein [candidate division KSB1 bacterium]|nr:OmpA family protein [candidate division KSB1 bacterium]
MRQKVLNEENEEIRKKAYELYEKHGFKDGNDFVDWLEAEKQTRKPKVKKQTTKHSGSTRNKQLKNILLVIVGVLCVIVVILLLTLLKSPRTELSEKSLSELKVMMLALEPKENEKVVVFGDTHFDFDQFTLSEQAKNLLDADVRTLKENPQIHVRMAGYTSAKGTEDVNQQMSEKRAGAVRDYLIEKGIAPERITTIGYGRTKPALYEEEPADVFSKEALANMRVLFQVVVK